MFDIDQWKTVDELVSRQKEVDRLLHELDEEHGGQAFPDDKRDEWNELNEERDALNERITELRAREERLKEIAADPERNVKVGPSSVPTFRNGQQRVSDIYDLAAYDREASSPAEKTRLLHDGAMRAVEGASFPHVEDRSREDVQAHIERVMASARGSDGEEGSGETHVARLILATGSPIYKRAFAKAIVGRPTTNEEAFALDRALSLTGGQGGFAVPFELDPTILGTSNGVVNPVRQVARVEQITVDEWRGVTSTGITAAYAAEATETTDNAPTLVQPTISTEKAQAFIPYSIEVGMDWGSLQTEMGRLLQEAKDTLEAGKFLNGTGTNEPFGVLVGTTNTINASAGADAFTLADLYALAQALPPRYRPRGVFMGDLAILNRVRRFGEATGQGAGVWVEGLTAGTPGADGRAGVLLGKPAYEASEMPDDATTGNKFLLFGDFSRFIIVDRVGLTVENIQHLFGTNHRPTGQRGIYAYWRNGSKVVDANAFRALLGTI